MKLKPVKLSAKRIVAATNHSVVPLRERKLNFGDKWNYAPAPEDSKNYVIAPRHELFIGGKFHGMICPATPSGDCVLPGNAYFNLSAQPA